MRVRITIFILIGIMHSISAQIGNEKDLIVRNKVKESFEIHCFTGSNSSCTEIWEKYDKNGNSIEWNMERLGSIYRNIYDKNDNKIFTLLVDKIDTTEIDTIPYVYDKNNQLIQDGADTFENFYNSKELLVKQISESQINEEKIVRKTKTVDWTNAGKVKTEIIKTEIIKNTKPTEYEILKVYRNEFKYDQNNNLTKEIHYQNDVVTNTIIYNYDLSNRLIERREKDISRIEIINSMKIGNRSDIKEFITQIKYNQNGSIKEKYTYFSDLCMSLDNHYLYKHFYLDNGLLEKADVYEDNNLVFSISYEYEYYK